MNNEKYNQIISDAWANYSKKVIANNLQLIPAIDLPKTQEEFINKCKTDTEFSKMWGLKIEERELSYKERWFLAYNQTFDEWYNENWERGEIILPRVDLEDKWNRENIPTKLITITHNNETIESHE